MFIGKRLKELRTKKRMQLSELSEASGVQIATLSRIEHNRMVGSLDSHVKITKALGVELMDLYSEIANPSPSNIAEVQKETPESSIFIHNSGVSSEILTSKVLSKKMMPSLLKIESGGQTNPEVNPRGSEKFIYILDGHVTAHINSKNYELSKGSSLYFDATYKHQFINKGKGQAKALVVTTPVGI